MLCCGNVRGGEIVRSVPVGETFAILLFVLVNVPRDKIVIIKEKKMQ